ncbi:MAG: protein kinase [Acidimicrobiales bacterium]|nr:protein kinase [Acidimicrobiales bacterium]
MLGPLEVSRDGEVFDLGVLKQRALLALLLINANEVVSTDRIIDELWGDGAGRNREKALWPVVSRLRAVLEPEREKRSEGSILLSRPPGYLLAVDAEDIDATRFESLAQEGRWLLETDPAAASIALSEALGLWRGHALEEFMYEAFAEAEITRLEEVRLAVLEDRIDADLRTGRARELIGELESLVRQHPTRERMTGHLMLALHLSGRQADSLRAFGAYRRHLSDELGLEPSAEMSRLEERILLDDPELRQVGVVRALAGRPEPGLSVRGYELREQIGAGAVGNVYRAYQPAVGREVAVKVIRPELANDPSFVRRFEAEAQLIARLEHPRIVPVYDYWREPDAAYLVTRRFERGSLAELLGAGELTAADAMKLIGQVGAALAAAHRQGVAHGDLKPENVLIDGEGNAFLADFGMSWSAGEAADFAPPELQAGEDASVAADIYSLGRLIEFTFPETETGVAAAVDRATAQDPAARYSDVDSLVESLAAAVGTTSDSYHEDVVNPYRGLHAFDESDASRFFGRERLIERVLARLGHRGPQGRFLAVVGPSGSGKSSVVRAGVVPALRTGAVPGSDRWFIATMIPGRHPFEALEEAVRSIAIDPPADLLERLSTDGIAATVAAVLPDQSAQVVLVIDQLEELFSLAAPDEADRFMTAIADAVADRHSPVKVIATLRADFYDHPLRHGALGELVRLGTEVITPMTADELERAITNPAAEVGVTFESGLVAAIVDEMAGQSTALPLMQYALTELFERRSGSTLSLEVYRELGGVAGALARRADGTFDNLTAEDQRLARQTFLRLVTLNDDGADTRRRAMISELNDAGRADTAPMLDAFGRHRLLTFDRDSITRGPTVEIAHEALISEWSRLRRWIDEARVDIQAERQLAAAHQEWESSGHDPDFLLAGARLAPYKGWSEQPPVPLTASERNYLTVSLDASEAELETERRRVQRLRRLVTGVGVVLVIALIAGGVAFQQQRRASAETDRAQLASLISRSAAAITDDPELSVLLALEAHERAPGDDTRRALFAALSGAGTANKVLSRQPLVGDCDFTNAQSSFYTTTAPGLVAGGPIQLQVIDGQAVARDVVTGQEASMGPMPFPCALGGRMGDTGGAGDIEGRLFVGPDYVELDVRGSMLGATSNRAIVAAEGPDGVKVRVYDMAGQPVGEPIAATFGAQTAMNGDGSLFATSLGNSEGRATDGTIYVIDTETGTTVLAIPAPIASALGFDPFTGALIAALADGTIVTFDLSTGDRLSQVAAPETFGYVAAGARADGSLVMVSRSSIEVIDRDTGLVGRPFAIQNVTRAFVRPDGLVVTIGNAGQADVWDLDANAVVERSYDVLPRGWIATVEGVAAVLVEHSDSEPEAEVIDLATGQRTQPDLTMPDGSTFPAVAAYPATEGVWAVSRDFRLARWRNGELVDELYLGSEPGVETDWYPGGRPYNGSFAILGLRGNFSDQSVVRGGGAVEASLVRLDDSAPGAAENVVTVETTIDPADPFGMAHPSPDGGLIVIDDLGLLTEYGPDGEIVRQIETGASSPVSMTIDPTGARLATSSINGGVFIVDLFTDAVELVPGNYIASSLGLNEDGSTLGISVWGGEVRMYDPGSGEIPTLIWDSTGTFGAEPGWFDAQNNSLWLPASGKVLEIPLDPARLVAKACEIVDRDLTQDEWDRYVSDGQQARSACADG